MGCIASATTVCIMIPMDTVKTRLVTQMNYPDLTAYAGINDCFRRVMKEEGIGAFYRGLTPRLLSVVPTIGIQFGVYEVSVYLYFFHHEMLLLPVNIFFVHSVYEEIHDIKGCRNNRKMPSARPSVEGGNENERRRSGARKIK